MLPHGRPVDTQLPTFAYECAMTLDRPMLSLAIRPTKVRNGSLSSHRAKKLSQMAACYFRLWQDPTHCRHRAFPKAVMAEVTLRNLLLFCVEIIDSRLCRLFR